MTLENSNSNKVFKYNMSFYYQSTIIYFIVFALYIVIKGNFVVDSFMEEISLSQVLNIQTK